jgi:glycerol-3-phosphate dehydrogenase
VDGAPGFFSVIGGKTTTARLMAEKIGDQVTAYLHCDKPCYTQTTPLLSYRKWSALPVFTKCAHSAQAGLAGLCSYPSRLSYVLDALEEIEKEILFFSNMPATTLHVVVAVYVSMGVSALACITPVADGPTQPAGAP